MIVPVNYRMLDHDVVVQVGGGTILDAAERHEVLSFEVDSVRSPEAWSVLARGPARVVLPDVAEAHARPATGRPYVPEAGGFFVAVRTDVLSGRRFAVRPQSGQRPAGPRLAELTLRPPVGVSREATIREAAAAMEEAQVSSVLLGGHPAWLVTEHDLVGALAAGLDPDEPGQVATRSPVWATTTTTVGDAAAMMAKHCVQHLLVQTADGELVGVLSRREALRQLLAVDLREDRGQVAAAECS